MTTIRPLMLGAALLLAGCSSPTDAPQKPLTPIGQASNDDLIARLIEKKEIYRGQTDGRSSDERLAQQSLLMNNLEHLLPSWRSEFLSGNSEPLERVLLTEVVTHYDLVADAFVQGPHERRLIAAWALGFTRVPPNSEGVSSRHDDAIELLNSMVNRADDDVLRNMLLAYWQLGDSEAPIEAMRDMIVQHHDEEVRSAAMLALGECLTPSTASRVVDSVLVAFDDPSGKVRLHAAKLAVEYPHPAYTSRVASLVRNEPLPLIQAAMARVLGASGDPAVERILITLLGSRTPVVAAQARLALVELTGRDEGPKPSDWNG